MSIAVGDRVCYSKQFCQATGQLTGDTPAGRGTVLDISRGSLIVATIGWDPPFDDLPTKVLVANLSRISPERGVEESA